MAEFTQTRSMAINAEPAVVHALINNFREWVQWSPWEGVDPDLKRTYSGADHGVGAIYEWAGNSKAGEGRMEITQSTPHSVVVDLQFIKPFKATNVSRFNLAPAAQSTTVTWTMTGERNLLMSVAGKLFFDKAIGKDFDRGLTALKRAAESQPE